MKDRFAGWIENQQDPYQDPYEDDENESEENEEYDEGDGEEEEYEDDEEEEYLDDESDEEYEDDEEEEEDLEEEEEEEEEAEEEIPAQAPASRPFGNGLNIQLGSARPQNNSAPQQGKGPSNTPGGGSFTPKQVRPAPQPAQTVPPKNFKPVQATAPAAAPSSRAQGEPASGGGVSENRAALRNRPEPLSDQEPEEFRAAEEDTPKKGFWSRLTGFRRNRDEEEYEEDYAETESDEEEFGEEETPRSKRLGIFSFFLNRRGNDPDSEETEEETEGEEEFDEADRPRIRDKFTKKFSALSNRVRSRLRKDEETLDEFEEDVRDSDEDDPEPGRPSRLKKAGIIGGAAALLLAGCYLGYSHLTKGNKENADPLAAETFSANLTSGEGVSSGTASDDGSLMDSIGSSFQSAADQLESTAGQLKKGVSDTFENLASRGSEAMDKLGDFGESVTEKVSDSLDGIREAVIPESGGDPALSEDLLANDDLLDAAPADKKGDSAASGDDTLDFDFGSESPASPADGGLSGQLSVSETRPPYGKDQASPSDDSLTFDQLKDQLSDAGEKVKEGFVSGVEKVGDSLDEAGRKTGDFLSGAGQKLDQAYQNTKEAASNAADDFKQDMAQARLQGEDAMQRVGEGVSSSLQAVGDKTRDAVEWTKDQFTADSSAAAQNVQAAPLSAAPAATQAGSSLQSGTVRSEPLQLSLDQNTKSEPLFLSPVAQNSSATSSLGGNAADTFAPTSTASTGRDAPLTVSSLASPGLSPAATQAGPESTLSSVSSLSEARNAATQEAAAVQKQTPDETFAAEPDLSVIGFGGSGAEDGTALSGSLSPLSTQYALPEETVPTAGSAQTYAGPAGGASANANANTSTGGEQLSSLDYNPADPAASAAYNNNQIGYSRLSGGEYGGAAPGSGYRQYVTKSGDNLIIIAENELGDASRWTEISKLNSNQNLRGRLREGIVIYLPESN